MFFSPTSRPDRSVPSTVNPVNTRRPRLIVENLEGREVPASGLGIASDYSAFILHDFNGQYSDIQGRLAVGGNATVTGYSVGDGLSDSNGTRDDVIVGGNLKYTNGQVFNGNVVYAGTGTFESFGIPNGTTRQGSVIDFGAAKTQLMDLSANWAGKATTGSVTNQWGIVTLTGTNAQTNVFNLKASDLWNANTVTIKAPAGSTVLVNVSGAEARMQYLGMSVQGTTADRVVFNFHEAAKVTLQGIGFQGSVMAPKAHVEFSNGNLEGTLIACSWNGYGEIHYKEPNIVVDVPKPPCGCVCTKGSNLSGLIWHDKNNDGLRDGIEMALAGVKIKLTGHDKDGNWVEKTVTTDAGGLYNFTDLKPGKYMIKVCPPAGYKAGKGSVGAFGGTVKSNMICDIEVPACKESGGYNLGQVCR